MPAETTNIFKDDPDLRNRLAGLDNVTSKALFSKWKISFLEVVFTFLEQAGSIKAEDAYEKFQKHVNKLVTAEAKVQSCLDNGSLSADNSSVKARMRLNELKAALQVVSEGLQRLLPGNLSDKVQYTNYHMGAILIREGFTSYGDLAETDVSLGQMKEDVLQHVADKQLLEEIDNYHDKLKMFCAIMADLGVKKIADKALEIAKLDEEDPEEDLEAFKPKPAESSPASSTGVGKPRTPPGKKCAPSPFKEETVISTAPPPSPPLLVIEEKEKELLLQTITVTATHDGPKPKPKPKPVPIRKKKKKVAKEDEDDLPRTVKPKVKAKMPGNDGGRGTGRMLSKKEAKEIRMPSPYEKVKNDAQPPNEEPINQRTKCKDAEEEKEDDNEEEEDDNEENDDEKSNDDPAQGSGKDRASRRPQANEEKSTAAKSPQRKSAVSSAASKKKKQPSAAKKIDNKVPIQVHTMDGKQIKIMVDPTKESLGDIKKQLESKTGMPVARQVLSGKYTGLEYQLDDKLAAFYGIKQGFDLDLDPKWILVNVRMPDGECHELKLMPAFDSSASIKRKITTKADMPVEKQVLKVNGNELPEKKIVKFMGILDGTTIHVEVFTKVPITVTTLDKKKIKLMVDLHNDTLRDIKEQLQKDTRMPADNQQLIMNGRDLVGDDVIAHGHAMQDGSELFLEPKCITIVVEMPNGNTHKLQVKLSSDMSNLITTMAEKEIDVDGATGGRIFKFCGKELSKGKTVKEMGIKDGSKIKLDLDNDTMV